MANIGPFELIVVLVIALVVLGPKRLPDVGRSVGRGMREFKDAIGGHDEVPDPDPLAQRAQPAGTVDGERATTPAANGSERA